MDLSDRIDLLNHSHREWIYWWGFFEHFYGSITKYFMWFQQDTWDFTYFHLENEEPFLLAESEARLRCKTQKVRALSHWRALVIFHRPEKHRIEINLLLRTLLHPVESVQFAEGALGPDNETSEVTSRGELKEISPVSKATLRISKLV